MPTAFAHATRGPFAETHGRAVGRTAAFAGQLKLHDNQDALLENLEEEEKLTDLELNGTGRAQSNPTH
jgi:hypothetical protein